MNYRNAIIIEGPDCSGKTTLAKRISEYYNNELDIVHCTGHDPKDYDFYLQLMKKKNVVYDRHFIGEMIYPAIFDRKPCLTNREFNKLKTFAEVNNIPVIVVAPPEEVLMKRLDEERPNEEIEIKRTIRMARAQFFEIAKNNPYFILVSPEDGNINLEEAISRIETVYKGE